MFIMLRYETLLTKFHNQLSEHIFCNDVIGLLFETSAHASIDFNDIVNDAGSKYYGTNTLMIQREIDYHMTTTQEKTFVYRL